MKSIRAVIVEDELLIAETIKIYLNERGHSIVGIAISYDEAIRLIAQTQPDVVLLDVRLYGDKSGIDVASHLLKLEDPIPYVMISSQYDISIIEDAMRAGASGYLTKPISKETLWSTVELAVMKLHEAIINSMYIDVKISRGIHRIYVKEILYIKADHVYIEIVCQSSKFLCRSSLKEMLSKIGQSHFIQCHRSYIVNSHKIQKFSNTEVWINDKVIPVSATYRDDILSIVK